MTLKPLLASLLTLGVVATTLSAPRHRDPLTQAEIDQVRDSSWDPGQRLPLYVKFARARLVQMETMRADPKAKDRVQQTHDLLDPLKTLGLPAVGDYSGLGPQVDTIDTIVQKVVLKVDRKGTEAAAATAIGASTSGGHAGPPHALVLDRPYLLIIQDTKTGTPLFLTRVSNPTA